MVMFERKSATPGMETAPPSLPSPLARSPEPERAVTKPPKEQRKHVLVLQKKHTIDTPTYKLHLIKTNNYNNKVKL